jgi:hypothetical protein
MKAYSAKLYAVALFLTLGAPVFAQTIPGDSNRGTRFGVQQLNNSGQVGTVTIFPHGEKTLVVIHLVEKESRGKTQDVKLARFQTCDDPNSATSPMPLTQSVDGRSSTFVNIPFERMLSGNYGVLVRSVGNTIDVACGHIDQTLNP